MKIKTSYSTIKKAFIMVDDEEMFQLFGVEDGRPLEFNKAHTMDEYIADYIDETQTDENRIKEIYALLDVLNKELKKNDIVQFLLVSEKQTENGIEV